MIDVCSPESVDPHFDPILIDPVASLSTQLDHVHYFVIDLSILLTFFSQGTKLLA
jgi:hypothetical protein